MREKEIEAQVCHYAISKGFLVRKYVSPNVQGVPDRILWGHGSCFLMEFKSATGKLSTAQEAEIARLRSHGAEVFIIDNVDFGRTILDAIIRRNEEKQHANSD